MLQLERHDDERGDFVKLYQRSVFEDLGFEDAIAEAFVSTSTRGVVRGLHFQLPPADHAKTIVCLRGSVFDVVVDLRVGSPTFGSHDVFELDERRPAALHIPNGCAHGFQATSDGALMLYLTSTEHDPGRDTGIRWDSVGVDWPRTEPTVSPRDRALPPLEGFISPFRYPSPG